MCHMYISSDGSFKMVLIRDILNKIIYMYHEKVIKIKYGNVLACYAT